VLALEGFLDTPFRLLSQLAPESRSRRGLCRTDFPMRHPFAHEDSFQESRDVQECVTPLKHMGGAGILTCCPSTTPFGLALGPTNPGTIRVALETLGLRWTGFSPVFLLLMPTFSLRNTPRSLPLPLQCVTNAPLPRPVLARRATSHLAYEITNWRECTNPLPDIGQLIRIFESIRTFVGLMNEALGASTAASATSVQRLSPGKFSAQDSLTSELLRFL
jgi:hypothetical protein